MDFNFRHLSQFLIFIVLVPSIIPVTILDSIQNSEDSSIKMSVWAKKAGGRFHSSTSTTGQPKIFRNEGEEFAFYESSEELECPQNEFWHLRSKQCVPIVCPKAKPQRNKDTGRCEPEHLKMGYTYYGYSKGVFRTPKLQLRDRTIRYPVIRRG